MSDGDPTRVENLSGGDSSDRAVQLSLLRDLEGAGALDAVSLTLVDPEMPFDRWESLGTMLGRLRSATGFWIGDWYVFGEAVYGEDAPQGVSEALDPETVRTYGWVARNVPASRRRPALPFSVHRVVAPLAPDEQVAWLNRAEASGLRRADLEGEVKAVRAKVGDGGPILPPPPDIDAREEMASFRARNLKRALIEAVRAAVASATVEDGFARVPVDRWSRIVSLVEDGE